MVEKVRRRAEAESHPGKRSSGKDPENPGGDLRERSIGKSLKEIFLGFVVGTANLLPGISGGTVVFISGRYPDFVEALGDLVRFRFKEKGKMVFLVNLGIGVVLAILTLSSAMDFLYSEHPKELKSFFSGLIMGGLMSIGMGITLSLREFSFIGLGMAAMILLESLGAGSMNPTPLNLVVGGVVAGASMILPGISGSSMLVILGLYESVVSAVARFDLKRIGVFGLGVVLGVALISSALGRLMKRNEKDTMAFLFGLTLVGLITLLMENVVLLYLILGIVAATSFERVMRG